MEFASGVAENVLGRLASYVAQEVCLACGAQHELKKLNKTLLAFKLVLHDAENKQMQNPLITHCLGNLKDVCNDAEDVLDEFEFRKLRLKVLNNEQQRIKAKVHQFFSRWNSIVFNFKMGHNIKEIRERLVEIDDEKTKFSLIQIAELADDYRADQRVHDTRREIDSLPKAYIVGRDKDKKHIINHLLNDTNSFGNENVSVISIIRLGGLGKTTLAKMVYNDNVVEENFETRLWICISNKFDVNTLVKGIIAETKKECDCGSLNLMKKGLQDILRGTKFLLVLG